MEQYSGAEAFLEVCNANGIDTVFINPGGEFASVNAACLRCRESGKKAPELVMCLHESVAMTAAYGHYLVSGKPQIVLVHSELGTQQTGGALHNAQWGRIPVVLMAGIQPAAERVNWKGEAFDQGLMVRNSVKWDHELTPEEDIHDVMKKALSIAFSEPRGPVYLYYSPAVLVNKVEKRSADSLRLVTEALPVANVADLEKIAAGLLSSENPLIVAGYTERYHENVQNLIDLAETLCAPVVPGLTRMNFPTTHPLCAGMEEMGGGLRGNEPFAEADTILVIDYDTPYVPAEIFPRRDARIFHIDIDPLTVGRRLWGRGAELFVKADSRQAIPALTGILRGKITPEIRKKLDARYSRLKDAHEKRRAANRATAMRKSGDKPVSPDWLAYCIAGILDDDTVLVNHLISQSSSLAAQVDRTKPGTLLACAGGSIMWALGAALGAKRAAPEKTVVSVMTDGGFVWGCPVASLWPAMRYGLPFLAVIFDNQSYGAIRVIVEQMAGKRLNEETGRISAIDIAPPADYALIAESCGGYGKTVTEPAELPPVLREALAEVKGGRVAVVDVRLPLG